MITNLFYLSKMAILQEQPNNYSDIVDVATIGPQKIDFLILLFQAI